MTCQIYLKSFTLAEAEPFFQSRGFGWSRHQIAECRMVFGGLPYFLDLLSQHRHGMKSAIRLVLVSASGIAGTAHTEHVARELTLDDLFA